MGLLSNVNYGFVFIEGIVSFFSPCVIPLIPLYMGYLAGGSGEKDENGKVVYKNKSIFLHTFFFILGISAAFFILGLGFATIGSVFKENREIISKVGGIIIILLGINQLGIFKFKFLNKQFKLNSKVSTKKMNPIVAFMMGFGFSFAWTPCVGPALASVLILASNASSVFEGNLLVAIYSVGFLIPFLVLGIFTGQTLNFIKRNPKIMDIIVKIGAIVLIAMGLLLFTGTLDKLEGAIQSSQTSNQTVGNSGNNDEDKAAVGSDSKKEDEEKAANEDKKEDSKKDDSSASNPIMPSIVLKDQHGNTVNLADQKGKVLFINFFATWCPPCKAEMPEIEKLYQNTGKNQKDTYVVAIVSPDGRQDINQIQNYIKQNKFTFPILIDEKGSVFAEYGVSSLPTTFLIKKNLQINGYIPGAINYDTMVKFINETAKK